MKELRELRDKLVEIRIAQQEQVERILARHEWWYKYDDERADKKVWCFIVNPIDTLPKDIEIELEKTYPEIEAGIKAERENEERLTQEYKSIMKYLQYLWARHFTEAIAYYKKGNHEQIIIGWFLTEAETRTVVDNINAWVGSLQQRWVPKKALQFWENHILRDVFPKILVGRPDIWSLCQIAIRIAHKKYPEIWKPFLLPDPEKSEQ